MTPTCHRRQLTLALLASALLPRAARANEHDWPRRPVNLIVPYPAGGGPDVLARLLAAALGPLINGTVVVVNRPGASGMLGVRELINAPSDGHALVYFGSPHLTTQAILAGTPQQLDMTRLLQPISALATSHFVLAVGLNSPYQTLEQLLAELKRSPGKLTYGSGGVGAPGHMAVELLRAAVPGVDAVHIPYKGSVDSINALRSGHIDFSVLLALPALPLIASGQLCALAVTGTSRLDALPEVRTFAEAGVAGLRLNAWSGLALHAATPKPIVDKLFTAVQGAMQDAAVLALVKSAGSALDLSASPAAFAERLRTTLADETRLVRQLQLKP